MNRISLIRSVSFGAWLTAAYCFAQPNSLSEASLLEYASAPYDKGAYREGRQVLGKLNDVEVVADFLCSDVCPDATVRIIHFNVEPGPQCAAIGGIEKAVIVPVAMTAGREVFCFPKVLTENWGAYVR